MGQATKAKRPEFVAVYATTDQTTVAINELLAARHAIGMAIRKAKTAVSFGTDDREQSIQQTIERLTDRRTYVNRIIAKIRAGRIPDGYELNHAGRDMVAPTFWAIMARTEAGAVTHV